MSAGPFVSGRYETISEDVVYPCRVQPETKELAINSVSNGDPAASVTPGVSRIALRRGRRAFGPAIRTATVLLTADGTGVRAEYKEGTRHVVPILAQATYEAWQIDDTGTYLGIACRLVGLFPNK